MIINVGILIHFGSTFCYGWPHGYILRESDGTILLLPRRYHPCTEYSVHRRQKGKTRLACSFTRYVGGTAGNVGNRKNLEGMETSPSRGTRPPLELGVYRPSLILCTDNQPALPSAFSEYIPRKVTGATLSLLQLINTYKNMQ